MRQPNRPDPACSRCGRSAGVALAARGPRRRKALGVMRELICTCGKRWWASESNPGVAAMVAEQQRCCHGLKEGLRG